MKREGKQYKFKNEVEYFDSYTEAIETCLNSRKDRSSMWGRWAGGIRSPEHAREMNKTGDLVGAERIKPSFDAAMLAGLRTQGETMQLDYAGYMPCIPSYLAGEPMHMRRNTPCETSRAPLTIVVGIGSSGGIEVETMRKRAVAIACLIVYLSIFRAVTVYTTVALQSTDGSYRNGGKDDYYLPMIKVGTSPMDLPQLAWQLTHPFAARGIAYSLGNYGESGITWARFNGKSAYEMKADEFKAAVTPILGLNEDDIVIPDCKLDDRDMHNPELWAKNRLRQMGYQMD